MLLLLLSCSDNALPLSPHVSMSVLNFNLSTVKTQWLLGKLRVAVDGFNLVSLKPGTVTELQLTNAAGEQMRTFADSNGWFTLHDVAPGTYVLTTINPMFIYPEVCAGCCSILFQLSQHAGLWSCSSVTRSDCCMLHTRQCGSVCECARGDGQQKHLPHYSTRLSTRICVNGMCAAAAVSLHAVQLQLDVTAKAGLARAAYLVNKQQVRHSLDISLQG